MCDEETLALLAEGIYDAALDPARWPDAIESVSDFVGGVAGWLMSRDCVGGTGKVLHGFGDQPMYRKLYFEDYVQLDPVALALSSLKPDETISHSRVMARDEFLRTRFYKEWMAPQGWLENAFVMLDRSATKITVLSIALGKGQDGDVESVIGKLQLLAPHLRRSVRAGKAVRRKKAQAAMLLNALDGIDAAVFFVDAEGRLLHANPNGAAILGEGLLLGATVAGQKLPEGSSGAALLDMFMRARRGGMAKDRQGICMPLQSANGDQYVLHALALPLAAGPRLQPKPSAHHRAVAALFLQKARIGGAGAAEAIARHYKLTPMELRVLLTVTDVGCALETANALGIAETTVRTHLRRLFGKTGTKRQLELAKLVAGYSSGLSR